MLKEHNDPKKLPVGSSLCSRSPSPWIIYGFPSGIMLLTVLFSLVFLLHRGHAIGPVVSLPDGKYQGTPQSDGITSWLGMRYAAAPVGHLRFAAPVNPPSHHGIEPANKVC